MPMLVKTLINQIETQKFCQKKRKDGAVLMEMNIDPA